MGVLFIHLKPLLLHHKEGIDTDVPDSYLWDVHSHKPRQLHLYGFEGKLLLNDMPVMTKGGRNRKASFTATLMMIWLLGFQTNQSRLTI